MNDLTNPPLYCIRMRSGEVLLRDGAFTDPGNCCMQEFGHVWHQPRLFPSQGEAMQFLARRFGAQAVELRYKVTRYTWALTPWRREGSIIKVACDLALERLAKVRP